MSLYKNKDLTIIIVIYNSTDKIIDLLQQLHNFEIIIVNNGKNEHIISRIKAHKNVKSIISKKKILVLVEVLISRSKILIVNIS